MAAKRERKLSTGGVWAGEHVSTVEWQENSEMVSDYSLFNEYKK
ncbi:hypothetical protein QG37_04517 [Candidozyma auris]|uniref:Uncharacterized protein n=1 Tax=Candidozyma auris TaxID=498019 RepID=A0A0L0NY79_CANAR|nr:hypothetical protein QG37_04517 [[Candida] auris]